MTGRYFEVIVSGRQLALLIATVVGLILAAFGLGVGVGLQQPASTTSRTVAGADHGLPALSGELRVPTAPTPPATVQPLAVVPTAAPTLAPPSATPTTVPTARPAVAASPAPERASPPPEKPPEREPPSRPQPRPTEPLQAWVQVAAMSHMRLAEGVRQRVIALGFLPTQVHVLPGTGGKYRVRVGPFPDTESAGRVAARLHAAGFSDAFTLRE
jgi:cell division protein FtsN